MLRSLTEELEIRQNFVCGRCGTDVAYQTRLPPAGSGGFLYVLKGAVSELYVLCLELWKAR